MIKKLAVLAMALALLTAVAQAQSKEGLLFEKEFKGEHWVDKNFASYSVKSIGLEVYGGSDDFLNGLAKELQRKGYRVVIKKGPDDRALKPEAKPEAVDATLKVEISKFFLGAKLGLPSGSGGFVPLGHDSAYDFNVKGKAQLSAAGKGQKVIYKATGQTQSVVKKEPGTGLAKVQNPFDKFIEIIEPLPPAP